MQDTAETKSTKAAIVPHGEIKGIGICGDDAGNIYIIRSDLLCYMKCKNHLEYPPSQNNPPGQNDQVYEVLPLHPACSEGDHYVRDPLGFKIIKGSTFFTVSDLTLPLDNNVEAEPLSDLCRDATAVLYFREKYYIIKEDNYVIVDSLTSTESTDCGSLYAPYKNALYFYTVIVGNDDYIGLVTQKNQGVIYWMTQDLGSNELAYNRFIFPNIVNFLPGGYSINFGISTAKWELLKSIQNNSQTELTWNQSIVKRVGFKKSEFESLEKNWNVSTELSIATSSEASVDIFKASIQTQFKLSASFGGASVSTQQEDWSEEEERREELNLTLKPGETIFIWQYKLGFGNMDTTILYSRSLVLTSTEIPPMSPPSAVTSQQGSRPSPAAQSPPSRGRRGRGSNCATS